MPRFSTKAKKIFDLIWYAQYPLDIEQCKIMSKELTTSLDISFVKIWFSFYYFAFLKLDLALQELKESDNINNSNPDNFISFQINWHYFYYYTGFHYAYPMISLEHSKQYFNKIESSYNQINFYDDWEKYFCDGIYNFMKGVYVERIERNIEEGILFLRKSKELFRLMPEDGVFFSRVYGNLNLAFFQRNAGHFNESEMNYQVAFQEADKYSSFWQFFSLLNLTFLNVQKGELQKALEFNEKHYELSKKFNFILGIHMSLGLRGDLFYEEGKYDQALELYQESLLYRKQYNDPFEIFNGYLGIFWFYYQQFKFNREQEYFTKAKETFNELNKFKEQYPENKTIRNYTIFSEARLLKYGNFTKRAKSVMLFEELMKNLPNFYDIVKEYLELLFEDFMLSEDQETMEKIDFLMKKVIDLPLSINSINTFVSQQIMLARYQFFIKNDIGSAFELLNKALEKIIPYKIERYKSQLENELWNFKKDQAKWEKADYSVKERIKKSEFQKYIQEALNIKIL